MNFDAKGWIVECEDGPFPWETSTRDCLPPLPSASHHSYRLHHYLLPTASHHYLLLPTTPCCLPRLLIPKDGLQPTFWDNFALCWSFSKEDLDEYRGVEVCIKN
jgi:hypothetical protein